MMGKDSELLKVVCPKCGQVQGIILGTDREYACKFCFVYIGKVFNGEWLPIGAEVIVDEEKEETPSIEVIIDETKPRTRRNSKREPENIEL